MAKRPRKPHKPLAGRDNDYLKIVVPAAARGDVIALGDYLESRADWLGFVGPHGRTLFWEAARGGKAPALRWLAERGADIHAAGCYHAETTVELSPLAIARWRGRSDAVQVLLELGAVDDPYAAAYRGEADVVAAALDADAATLDRPCPLSASGGVPLLAYAVAGGRRALAVDLLARGARTDFAGERLLVWAMWADDHVLCAALLAHGAVPGDGLLVEWAESAELCALARRFGYEPDINGLDGNGFPPLVDACRGNHNAADDVDRVERYLDLGADIMARDAKGKTGLHRAAQAGFLRIPRLLLRAGAELEARDLDGQTPLFDGVRAGRIETVRLLLEEGADAAAEDKRGRTVLHYAKRSRKPAARQIEGLLGAS